MYGAFKNISNNEENVSINPEFQSIQDEMKQNGKSFAKSDLQDLVNKDLMFYNKTSFVKYFENNYTEKELENSLNNASITVSRNPGKPIIKVSRKSNSSQYARSFSSDFYIAPVPSEEK